MDMLFARVMLISIWLFGLPCMAGVAVDLGVGRSMSGSFNTGNSLPLQQQSLAICADYIGVLSRGFLGGGNERFGLGLGLYVAQVNYTAGAVKNTGGNFFLTARAGWLLLAVGKTWLIQVTPEFLLYSRMSAASYSTTTVDDERVQSASLSSFRGMGAVRLSVSAGRKINFKLGQAEIFAGGGFSALTQSFSQREDTVVATSPSTGKVTSLKKNRGGSYSLQAMSLELHLTFML
jgi:hypothetical protein